MAYPLSADGLFYADISLPLTISARKAIGEQPGAHWNLLQVSGRAGGFGGRVGGLRGWGWAAVVSRGAGEC